MTPLLATLLFTGNQDVAEQMIDRAIDRLTRLVEQAERNHANQ